MAQRRGVSFRLLFVPIPVSLWFPLFVSAVLSRAAHRAPTQLTAVLAAQRALGPPRWRSSRQRHETKTTRDAEAEAGRRTH